VVEAALGKRRGGDRPSEDFQTAKNCDLKKRDKLDAAAKKAGFGNHETYNQAKRVVASGTPELVAAAAEVATPPKLEIAEHGVARPTGGRSSSREASAPKHKAQ